MCKGLIALMGPESDENLSTWVQGESNVANLFEHFFENLYMDDSFRIPDWARWRFDGQGARGIALPTDSGYQNHDQTLAPLLPAPLRHILRTCLN